MSSTWAKRKKKISTPVTRWATHVHMPSRPRYKVPECLGHCASLSCETGDGGRVVCQHTDGSVRIIHIVVTHRIGARRGCGVCEQLLTAHAVRRCRSGNRAAGTAAPSRSNVTGAQERSARVVYGRGHVRRVAASASSVEDFWAVIPAGGAGTRLWPLSRASAPKFLHDLTGTGRSLLQSTWDRLAPLCGDHIMVVTGVLHAGRRPHAAAGPEAANLLAEPSPRDSMAAIGLAAAVAGAPASRGGHRLLRGRPRHRQPRRLPRLRRARRSRWPAPAPSSRSASSPPTRRPGSATSTSASRCEVDGAPHALAVSEFVEKPDAATAGAWLATGEYRWNAGMFVVRASVLLDLLASYQPELARGLRALAAEPERLEELWPGLTKIAIDHAVAEPAAADGRVAVVPGDLRLGRRGRLLLARLPDRRRRRPARGQDPRLARPRPGPRGPRAGRPRRRAAPSPCSGWRTSSWSTPRTRCW